MLMKKLSILLLCITSFLCLIQPIDIEAATEKKAQSAYDTFLKKHPSVEFGSAFYDASYQRSNKSYVNSYAIYDLDGDKIPELITETPVNFRWFIVRIYTYKNGKVIAYKFSSGEKVEFDDCATANGEYYYYICKKGHLHNCWSGDSGTIHKVYSVKNKKLKEYLSYEEDEWIGTRSVTRYGKSISKKKFEKLTKSCSKKKILYKNNNYKDSVKKMNQKEEATFYSNLSNQYSGYRSSGYITELKITGDNLIAKGEYTRKSTNGKETKLDYAERVFTLSKNCKFYTSSGGRTGMTNKEFLNGIQSIINRVKGRYMKSVFTPSNNLFRHVKNFKNFLIKRLIF